MAAGACERSTAATAFACRVRAKAREQLEADVSLAVHRPRVDLRRDERGTKWPCRSSSKLGDASGRVDHIVNLTRDKPKRGLAKNSTITQTKRQLPTHEDYGAPSADTAEGKLAVQQATAW
uniref:Uncharacterized protein n=1 Tax=Chrysotila carterae TaxID=13221 RepID=A0A7S4F6I0_CHRCT